MPWILKKNEEMEENPYGRWIFKKLFRFLHFSIYYRLGLMGFLWVILHCLTEMFEAPFTSFCYGFAWGLFGAQFFFVWIPPLYAFL